MAQIENETQYKATQQRIEELLKVVGNDTPPTDPNFIELSLISDLVADYEELQYPVKPLSFAETIGLRMSEIGWKCSKVLKTTPFLHPGKRIDNISS